MWAYRQMGRQIGRQIDRLVVRQMNIDGWVVRQTVGSVDREADSWVERKTPPSRHIDRYTDW